jgi:hypothetical protein
MQTSVSQRWLSAQNCTVPTDLGSLGTVHAIDRPYPRPIS